MSGAAYYVKYHEIVEAIGQASADDLVRTLGGTRFYVRETITEDHFLAVAIGIESATKFAAFIVDGLSGLHIEIPSGRFDALTEFHARLKHMVLHSGMTENEIAAQMGVHGRTVRRMRAKVRREREAVQVALPAR